MKINIINKITDTNTRRLPFFVRGFFVCREKRQMGVVFDVMPLILFVVNLKIRIL